MKVSVYWYFPVFKTSVLWNISWPIARESLLIILVDELCFHQSVVATWAIDQSKLQISPVSLIPSPGDQCLSDYSYFQLQPGGDPVIHISGLSTLAVSSHDLSPVRRQFAALSRPWRQRSWEQNVHGKKINSVLIIIPSYYKSFLSHCSTFTLL